MPQDVGAPDTRRDGRSRGTRDRGERKSFDVYPSRPSYARVWRDRRRAGDKGPAWSRAARYHRADCRRPTNAVRDCVARRGHERLYHEGLSIMITCSCVCATGSTGSRGRTPNYRTPNSFSPAITFARGRYTHRGHRGSNESARFVARRSSRSIPPKKELSIEANSIFSVRFCKCMRWTRNRFGRCVWSDPRKNPGRGKKSEAGAWVFAQLSAPLPVRPCRRGMVRSRIAAFIALFRFCQFIDLREQLFAVSGLNHLISHVAQHHAEDLEDEFLVVHYHDQSVFPDALRFCVTSVTRTAFTFDGR